MNRRGFGLVVALALLVACAPGPDDWSEVITVQTIVSPFPLGKLGILTFSCKDRFVGDMVADSVAANLLDSPFAAVERVSRSERIKGTKDMERANARPARLKETANYRKLRIWDVDYLLFGDVSLQKEESIRWRFWKFEIAEKHSFVTKGSAYIVSTDTEQVLVSCSFQIPGGGAGSVRWTPPSEVGKAIASALKEALEKANK